MAMSFGLSCNTKQNKQIGLASKPICSNISVARRGLPLGQWMIDDVGDVTTLTVQ